MTFPADQQAILMDRADEKAGPVVPYRQIQPVLIVYIYLGTHHQCVSCISSDAS